MKDRFTGKIDELTFQVGPSQLSKAAQQTAAEASEKASD
jgi:hypothetical protein